MPARSFYFLRHGQTDWNKEQRMQGHTDIPLNETGRQQARNAMPIFASHTIDMIVASPLQRAYETAQIVAASRDIPILTHADLRERHYGSSEGKLFDEIKAHAATHPDLYELSHSGFPHIRDSETSDALKKRTVNAVKEMLATHEGNVLFVAHGGVFSAIHQVLIKGEYVRSENAVPYLFLKENESWICAMLAS